MSPISNAPQTMPPSDSLALVNSFYGPGATACWYLTCFSCLISWTVNPKKRTADAITNDSIAMITFPCVGSAHLISQVCNWPSEMIDEDTLGQMRASLSASLIIVETYLALCVILLLPGLFSRVPKRLSLLGTTGILCVVSESYLYVALPGIRHAPGVFERSFIIDSLITLVLVIGLASILAGLLLLYIFFLISRSRNDPAMGIENEFEDDFGLSNKPRETRMLTFLSLPFMVISFCASCWSLLLDFLLMIKSHQKASPDWTGRRSLIDEFFPKTEASIMDLDQAVALFAGMTVLGFSLYSAANTRYEIWVIEEKKKREEVARQRVVWREIMSAAQMEGGARELDQRNSNEGVELPDWRRSGLSGRP